MTDIGNNKIEQGFIRQRRNLILVSLVLLLILTEELTFVKLNFLGNVTELKNQSSILFILWTGWLYWSLRYYQYYRDLGDKGFKTAFLVKFHSISEKVAQRKALKSNKWKDILNSSKIDSTYEILPGKYRITTNTVFYLKGTVILKTLRPGAPAWEEHTIKIGLKGRELLASIIKACVHVLVNTTLATEYLLPFIISTTPIVYVIGSQLSVY